MCFWRNVLGLNKTIREDLDEKMISKLTHEGKEVASSAAIKTKNSPDRVKAKVLNLE